MSFVDDLGRKHYVNGFVLDTLEQRVLLIEKKRPDWQRGFLNGIGGKVEVDETPHDAMVREFREEAGLSLPRNAFFYRGTVRHASWVVHYFLGYARISDARQTTDEKLVVCKVNDLPVNAIQNLRWLIPLCRDRDVDIFSLRDLGTKP